MPRDITDYVAENAKAVRDIDGRTISVTSARDESLSFGTNFINVNVAVDVYIRPTGTQVVFGHAGQSKGFGRGTFGDDKGAWSKVADSASAAEFTRTGRKAVAQALDGGVGAVSKTSVGSGGSTPSVDDTALDTEYAISKDTFGLVASNTVTARGLFESTIPANAPAEVGVVDSSDRLLARATIDTSAFGVAPTDDLRTDVSLTFEGDGNGVAVFTNDGQDALANAIKTPKTPVGPTEWAFGSGTTDFSKSDTSLSNELFRKGLSRDVGRDRIGLSTRVTESDLSGVSSDITEAGVFDNDGRMLWATTFLPVPPTSTGFTAETTFVVA